MLRRPPHNSALAKILAVSATLAISVGVAGCGNDSKTDLVNGKTQFIAKCGACHTLARANTAGTIGPDLDDAFRQSREDGFGDTIEGIVLEQIKLPSQDLTPKSLVMPANLVEGMDAADVAAYVSYAAANPGKDSGALAAAGGGTDGKGLFKTNCGSCHTLADAATSGTVGPNLNAIGLDDAAVAKQIANGGGGMPAFGGTLTEDQIKLIAKYVSSQDGS
jgi:mono/diheme cytochrome c family protein